MHPEIHELYALHQIDARILQLERDLSHLDNGEAARKELATGQQALAKWEEALKKARVRQGDAEGALKANEAKQAQYGKLLYGGSVHSQREAEAMEHEIAALKSKAGDLETAILETMDEIETGDQSVAKWREAVAKRERALASVVDKYKKDAAGLKQQIEAARQERDLATDRVSAVLLARYDSIRKRTKDTGLTVLEGNSCSTCRMQVPGLTIQRLINETDLTLCDNCGRILYRPPA